MKNKSTSKVLALFLMVALLLGIASPISVLALSSEPQNSVQVDPEVMQEMETKGSASYWIDFDAKADLSAANSMDWSKRGWYVYETLSKTASASQARVAAYLTDSKVEYQAYWIKNTILVKSSNLTTLNGLLGFSEIKAISPRQTYILYEPDRSAAVIDNGLNSIEPNLTHINADDVWAMGIDGSGLVVANIDTGVRFSHQALVEQYRGNNGDGTFDHNYNWFNPDDLTDDAPRDGNGHGTHTMGTMVGDDGGSNQVGIAPGAQWMACAGCPDGSCTDTALLGCGQFIAAPTDLAGDNADPDMRPNAVNNSWGDCGQTYDDWYADVISAWHAGGIYPIFSNGNSINCGYSSPPGLNTVGNPARSGDVTGVGSSGEQNGQYATHSNWGPTDNADTVNPTDGFIYMKPQVLAPGVSIRSSTPGSDTEYQDGWTGTSMSAPHVTGLVALIWQAAPCLVGDYATTENIIEESAVDITYTDGSSDTPTDFPNYATGWGEIDALAAVTQASGLCAMGTLEGTVTEDGTTPIEGAKIFADNGEGYTKSVYSAADGSYSTGLPEGTYTLTASKYGFDTEVVSDIVIVEDGTTTQDFVLAPLGMTTVSGVVYDAGVEGLGLHGYPLYASIHITATGFDQTIYSDPITGEYSIDLVSETEHTFEVTSVVSGYEPLVDTVTPTTDALTHDIGLGIDGEVCAAPGYQPDYDFFWSFEQSDGGFTSGGTNSSWAWGDFTSGPGEGHSGTKGIATNPAGNYNNYEESWMVSPVIDLSGFGTNTPVLQWWDWLFVESVTSNWDWAFLQVTKDGTNWTTVWGPDKRQDSAYSQQTAVLDPSYNVSTFQFRFSFHSDVSGVYPGWYVDDVGIVEIAAPLPTVLYSSDFESNDGGFVVGGTSPSWEVGKPTSGPEAAHSGLVVWATNLAGDYNSSEDSYITSPLIDLSANPTLAPTISFYHWMQSESNSYDWGAVEATKDGGVTWDIVWQKFGNITEWTPKSLQLDSSYAISNFQFRFHFHSDSSVNYPGWYIDDVAVSVAEPFVIAAPCVVIPGGAVAGYVTDEITSEPLIGADVYSDTVATKSFALEGDPDNAGLYWVFQPTTSDPEDVVFTASKDLYADETATVSVVQDAVKKQDFALGTGELTFDPTKFEFTMAMDDAPATGTLTIGNNGTSDATFELVEKDEGFTPLNIPAFTGELPEDNREVSLGRAPQAATNVSRSSSAKNDLGGILSTTPAFAMDVYPGENLVYIPDTTVPGTWEVVGSITGMSFFAGDFVGGDFDTMYVVNYDNNGLYAVDTATGAYTQIGTTTPPLGTISGLSGTPDGIMYGIAGDCATSYLITVDITSGATTNIGAISGVGCGIDLAYNTNDDMIYVVDLLTSSLFRVDPVTAVATLVGSLGVNPNYAQGMDFEEESGVLYWAAYTTQGELRVIDTTTGASTLIGAFPGGAEVDCLAFPTGGSADVPWLSEDPVSGTVPADDTVDVTITVDPADLGQPGDYAAALKVKHNTPYTYPNIPVILHLVAPEDFGTINGTVNGLEACDVNPAPIEGATVNFKQDDIIIYTTTTLANGYYSYSMPAGEYDIEVIAEGFVSQTVTGVDVVGGSTVTQDFELRLLAPCLSAVPSELEKTLIVDQIGTETLTIINTGTVAADIELFEVGAGITSTLLSEGFEEGIMPPSGGWETIHLGDTTREWTIVDAVTYPDFVYEGDYSAWINYDSSYDSDEWLLTPVIDSSIVTDLTLTFYAESDTEYPTATMKVWVTDEEGDPLTDEPIWDMVRDETWSDFEYRLITVDLSDFDEYGAIRVAWQYVGLDGESFGLDNIEVSGELDVPWLSEDPMAGTVPAGGSLPITVTFDATGLDAGDYLAALRVHLVGAPNLDVPVTLHVVELWKLYLPLIAK
ncbi:MAG TPA: S8 family serine peptidase [Anaerolineaceae bacterium]|nr:S8 family serine peptidase [Anaerolineaceae bacterium]